MAITPADKGYAMYFHPWVLLFGADYLGVSLLSWISPFVMDGPANEGMSQFMGRYVTPILGAILVVGAFMQPHDPIPENVLLPFWLRVVLVVWFLGDIFLLVRLRRQRRQWKAIASEQPLTGGQPSD